MNSSRRPKQRSGQACNRNNRSPRARAVADPAATVGRGLAVRAERRAGTVASAQVARAVPATAAHSQPGRARLPGPRRTSPAASVGAAGRDEERRHRHRSSSSPHTSGSLPTSRGATRHFARRILLGTWRGFTPATARSAAQLCAIHFHIDHQPREQLFHPLIRGLFVFRFPPRSVGGIFLLFLQTVSNSGNLSQSLANRPGG